LFQYCLTVIFRHKLIVPVVHFYSLAKPIVYQESKSLRHLQLPASAGERPVSRLGKAMTGIVDSIST
jgi:hypothetical protein